ncbi:MAG: phosphoribosylaminoimidazolesuccinocarboxamide synthase [Synergistaceae bacterium]|nr:phosphoribosylaminoimidazolesuccinocarboxamide synthase [Synergistaceae bacterium]
MEKLQQLYEGKAKKVYAVKDDADLFIVEYKDDATAFNGEKRGTITGKGVINNKMSNILFKMLEANGVKTHFVKELSDRETLVKAVKIIPLEIIIRNVAAGSFSKRYGVEEGRELKAPTLEFSLKNDALNDPFINNYHIIALDIASEADLKILSHMAFKINELLKNYFANMGVMLIDFKI